jgi:hypothetical protein
MTTLELIRYAELSMGRQGILDALNTKNGPLVPYVFIGCHWIISEGLLKMVNIGILNRVGTFRRNWLPLQAGSSFRH